MELNGTYQATGKGFGFLIPEDGKGREDDWFVPPRSEGGAWNGDRVLAVPVEDDRGGQRRTAKITAVVERANKTVTGAIERQGREVWLRPGSDRLPHAIKVVGRTRSARAGDKAAVAVTSYGNKKLPPMGTLREIFGKDGTRPAAVEAILYQYGIERAFPVSVQTAAELAPREVVPADLAGRLDLRGKTVITIDGASSKDFDDAVSLERDARGRWVLGVHIADVSHYVAEGSPLDLEAWNRGTSVYFADQVVPMLPPELSNGICSLNPHVDRLALSCILTIGPDGAVLDHRLVKSVIRSTERMTYGDCNTLLAGLDPELEAKYAHILPMLRDMAALAAALEQRRRLRGALDLESRECHVICDELGDPVDVQVRETGVSEALIESFMLSANECVAEHLFQLHAPAVYRVHEKPSEDKVATLRSMLAPLGYDLREADHFSLQKVLEKARDTPQAPAIHMMVLRSLMKARYDVENLGHFGLAAKFYCHFTSPIRRYPDMMVHRLLARYLADGKAADKTMLEDLCFRASEREVIAAEAERASIKYKMVEFMKEHIGEEFEGHISGLTEWGIYVELDETHIEGMSFLRDIDGDFFQFDEANYQIIGRSTGRRMTLGDAVRIRVKRADLQKRQLDFEVLLDGLRTPAPAEGQGPQVRRSNRRKNR